LVKKNANGAVETLKIRIANYEKFLSPEDSLNNMDQWLLLRSGGSTAEWDSESDSYSEPADSSTLKIYTLFADEASNAAGNMIDAGDGTGDFVFHSAADQVTGQESEVEVDYSTPGDPSRTESSGDTGSAGSTGDTLPAADSPATTPASSGTDGGSGTGTGTDGSSGSGSGTGGGSTT